MYCTHAHLHKHLESIYAVGITLLRRFPTAFQKQRRIIKLNNQK